METPKTESGKLTELVMAEIRLRLPNMGVAEYNTIYSCCLQILASASFERVQRIEDLSMALRDAISTYGDKPEILVTTERQEAWQVALERSGM